MKILFLQTGGSIDKDYPTGDEDHGYSFVITAPAYERILERVHPSFEVETKTILQKDSLDMTDEDRAMVLQACEDSQLDKIIITHGTDTMLKTAKVLSELHDKTIVLTGSFSPELFKNSDADFNLGMAVGTVTVLKPGVYIAMNGRVLDWDEAVFDDASGQFVSTQNE